MLYDDNKNVDQRKAVNEILGPVPESAHEQRRGLGTDAEVIERPVDKAKGLVRKEEGWRIHPRKNGGGGGAKRKLWRNYEFGKNR